MNMLKVVWQEGMLLRPQHFQQQDRYLDQQITARTQLLELYAWGFFTLEIDRQFLALGKLVISQASGLLPDGSFFDLASLGEPLAIDIPSGVLAQPVYLALPLVIADHQENCRGEQRDVITRYRIHDLQVADCNADVPDSATVSCARPAFRLLLGDDIAKGSHVCLKVADVLECNAEGAVRLDPQFSPTVLHYQASPQLLSCLKEIIGLLAHRGDRLAERLRGSQPGAAQVSELIMLQLINGHEAQLRHYLGLQQLHPESLYRELLTLLGELATFSDHKRPGNDWRYQHHDQAGSFQVLLHALRQMMATVMEPLAMELPLQLRQYGIRVAPLVDHSLLQDAMFVLIAQADCDSETLRTRLPNHLKIGAVEHIRQLVNLHLPGIRLRALPTAPPQLPFHAGKSYFALELDNDDRAQLENAGGFAFHLAGEFDGLELSFWMIRS